MMSKVGNLFLASETAEKLGKEGVVSVVSFHSRLCNVRTRDLADTNLTRLHKDRTPKKPLGPSIIPNGKPPLSITHHLFTFGTNMTHERPQVRRVQRTLRPLLPQSHDREQWDVLSSLAKVWVAAGGDRGWT